MSYRTTLFMLCACPHNNPTHGVGLGVAVLWELSTPVCPYITRISGNWSFRRKFFKEFTFFIDQINKYLIQDLVRVRGFQGEMTELKNAFIETTDF